MYKFCMNINNFQSVGFKTTELAYFTSVNNTHTINIRKYIINPDNGTFEFFPVTCFLFLVNNLRHNSTELFDHIFSEEYIYLKGSEAIS